MLGAMTKLILFDIDGTLVRTGGAGVKAFARAFQTEFGLNDGAEKLKFAGRTDVFLVREFFSHHNITPDAMHFERFFETYLRHLTEMILDCKGDVCPGVHQWLNELGNLPGAPAVGLLTGNIRRGAAIKLGHYNLWKKFSFGGFADDCEERDGIAAVAMQRGEEVLKTKLRGAEVLVIGDTPLDIRCARAIGAKVLAVATGGSTVDELQAHQPDWAVENLLAFDLKQLR
jgi:phosphoglycolate phosphatase-like HAD superfamily hydrolase